MMLYVQFDALGRAAVIYDTPRDGAEPVEGLDRVFLARHRRTDKGEWVAREAEPETEYQPTPEEIEAAAEEARRAEEAARKITGIEFEGVLCSATSQDQAGLVAVLLNIQLEGAAFQPTEFHFENGSRLVIHLGNWRQFSEAWRPFRQSFFKVTP